MTAPPRGRAVAGAQVASRRKAHHGSSRTVFHEGSGLSPGDTNAPTGVEREAGQCYSGRETTSSVNAKEARTAVFTSRGETPDMETGGRPLITMHWRDLMAVN